MTAAYPTLKLAERVAKALRAAGIPAEAYEEGGHYVVKAPAV